MTKIRTVFYMVIDQVIVGFKHAFFFCPLLYVEHLEKYVDYMTKWESQWPYRENWNCHWSAYLWL